MSWKHVDVWEMPQGEQPHESLYDAVMKSMYRPPSAPIHSVIDLADERVIETIVSNMDVKR